MVLLQKDFFIVDIYLAWPLEISPELETLLNKAFTLNFFQGSQKREVGSSHLDCKICQLIRNFEIETFNQLQNTKIVKRQVSIPKGHKTQQREI